MTALGTRKVLVTGGGTGIGRAVAEALLRSGAEVVVTGRRLEKLEEIDGALPLRCDLTDPHARTGLLKRARDLMGGLDGFVHSAGVVVHQLPGYIEDSDLEEQLEVNLVAPLRLGEEALAMLDDGGAMVFVSSTLAQRPVATSAVYSAAKAGMLAAMKALALAGAPRRIRANAVLPGVIDTEMIRGVRLAPGEEEPTGAQRDARIQAQLEGLRTLHPLGRLGNAEDIAEAVLHLLSAQWTTGTELVVDGGLLLRE